MSAFKRRGAALGLIAVALLILFSSSLHADASTGIAAPGTIYLPLVFRDFSIITPPPPGNWLAYVNYYRALARLPAVTENPSFSDGDFKHARYMVINNIVDHTEVNTNPGYTPEGAAAGLASNVMGARGSTSINFTDEQAIEVWMRGPFHAIGIIDPKLLQTGFGSYREIGDNTPSDVQMAAALDVNRGLGAIPGSVTFPVKWPSDSMVVNLKSYDGFENPDPLSSCPGYAAPTGLPIIFQVGAGGAPVNVSVVTFKQGNTTLPSCSYNENTYTNSANPTHEPLGRAILAARDAIVIIPRNPLTPGATYTVSVTVNGQTHTWLFSVSTSALSFDSLSEALIR
jgi:hypothetical protein